MVLCNNCKKELPNIKCKNCDEMKSSDNFKTNSRVCNECNKMRYDAWKEVNKDKWRKGGDYYKYEKKGATPPIVVGDETPIINI